MKHAVAVTVAAAIAVGAVAASRTVELRADTSFSAESLIYWSRAAQNTIVPKKFPGEAAVHMGIVHVALYDTAVAFEGGYQPYASTTPVTVPQGASPDAAIATAAYDVLVCLLSPQHYDLSDLQTTYSNYLAELPDPAKSQGIGVGAAVARLVCALPAAVSVSTTPNPPYVQPTPGPGVWEPDLTRAILGLRLPLFAPLAMMAASQFRPGGPNALTSDEYAGDFNQTKGLGELDNDSGWRTAAQTEQALFWTDHDLRQWNEGMLAIASDRGLDMLQAARMLAVAHVSGGDAMIACFDAKFHYTFWRPYRAIPAADTDGNPLTSPDADNDWQPLRITPNFPEYPSAHACHSGAVTNALAAFFGTDRVRFSLYSGVTNTVRRYGSFHDALKDVNEARVLAGFHFRNSDQQGANLGRTVATYVTAHRFLPLE